MLPKTFWHPVFCALGVQKIIIVNIIKVFTVVEEV